MPFGGEARDGGFDGFAVGDVEGEGVNGFGSGGEQLGGQGFQAIEAAGAEEEFGSFAGEGES